MNYVKNGLSIVFLGLCCGVFAADIPQNDMGASEYNSMECVAQNSETCIDSVCLNSEEIDCEANCRKVAQEKCADEADD